MISAVTLLNIHCYIRLIKDLWYMEEASSKMHVLNIWTNLHLVEAMFQSPWLKDLRMQRLGPN